MWNDPIVEETRKLRDEYAGQFDYDVWRIFRDLKERERKSGSRYVSFPPRNPAVPKTPAA